MEKKKKRWYNFLYIVFVQGGDRMGESKMCIRDSNIDNLIRKQCYHYRIFSENGSHKYEFAGTEWLNPQGDSVAHLSARGA